MHPAQSERLRRRTRLTLMVCQALYILYAPAWLVYVLFSTWLGDGPQGLIEAALAYGNLGYPVAAIGGLVRAWGFFGQERYRDALLWGLAGMLWVVPALLFLVAINLAELL